MGRKSKRLKELEKIFSNLEGIEIGEPPINSSIRLNGSCFGILCYDDSKEANVLRFSEFREKFGEDSVREYKHSLLKLKKADYRIRMHDFLGPHLLRIVT